MFFYTIKARDGSIKQKEHNTPYPSVLVKDCKNWKGDYIVYITEQNGLHSTNFTWYYVDGKKTNKERYEK